MLSLKELAAKALVCDLCQTPFYKEIWYCKLRDRLYCKSCHRFIYSVTNPSHPSTLDRMPVYEKVLASMLFYCPFWCYVRAIRVDILKHCVDCHSDKILIIDPKKPIDGPAFQLVTLKFPVTGPMSRRGSIRQLLYVRDESMFIVSVKKRYGQRISILVVQITKNPNEVGMYNAYVCDHATTKKSLNISTASDRPERLDFCSNAVNKIRYPRYEPLHLIFSFVKQSVLVNEFPWQIFDKFALGKVY